MENASKALLIAAAVLIVILIIAFGMRIFNSTGDTAGQVETTAESTSMQTFNAQFSAYIGSNRSGSVLRNLVVLVNKSNTANPSHQVTLTGADALVDTTTYTVTATYDTTTGYITEITVQ